jgi:hypothetical protein
MSVHAANHKSEGAEFNERCNGAFWTDKYDGRMRRKDNKDDAAKSGFAGGA